ncbi:MAG TPA: cytochrome c peroxidase [Bryobacteraceae bacterium]|nr:cytochrome c peroxidase [Bryobacteraceae bacterium]
MKSGIWVLVIVAALAAGCGRNAGTKPIGKTTVITAPLGLPPVPVPADNPPTEETIALGKKLFFDPRLSADGKAPCSACHSPEHGFSDGRKTSMGVRGQLGKRNAPTIFNSAYSPLQFWDGRAASLEDQAAGPIANPIEMDMPHTDCVTRVQEDPEYQALFAKAFGPGAIGMTQIQKAIAAYERTILSGNSPFDRYYYGGDKEAMSPAAVRGFAVFMDREKGNCSACHQVGTQFALFTDGQFHNLGAGMNSEGELTDLGRYDQTKSDADRGAFKTPTLRNITLTAPYMHDGSLRTLRAVVDFYVGGGNSNPHLDKQIKPLPLTGQDREDLVTFLEALTSENPRQR